MFLLDEFCYCFCGFRTMGFGCRCKLDAEAGAGLQDTSKLEDEMLEINMNNYG